ncbi:SDR family NAD(P)-dependent oxidoreductase [Paenibacillus sp. LMG 31461]|uniref:SDR family NAD(P)-dependent oxidoreductase n=1 Tax=Paenibacillus plantarum TaxID=2654975 RepID=A0ABX1XE22_9BACL|nr:SDR family NAD(P)-dependent oxidoreductase [Paenibacillus plantarum]NOU66564.1 SDR family NAD(P)-dependent oxidoreductase [Paenibacillus plantarum]
MKLTGHCILITGGSAGIGLSLAKRLAEKGNKVIIASSNVNRLDQAIQACPALIAYPCNLENPADVHNFTQNVLKAHPDLNILINNAGIQLNYDFLQEPDPSSKINREIQINLTSTIQLCSNFLTHLTAKPNAAIVNVSSGLGLVPKKSAPVYCATKAAVHLFTKGLRYQLEATRVKVFEIIPPLVSTEMTEGRGKGKITPDQLVNEFVRGFERDRYEILIGKIKLLRMIQRISPSLADKLLKNG